MSSHGSSSAIASAITVFFVGRYPGLRIFEKCWRDMFARLYTCASVRPRASISCMSIIENGASMRASISPSDGGRSAVSVGAAADSRSARLGAADGAPKCRRPFGSGAAVGAFSLGAASGAGME